MEELSFGLKFQLNQTEAGTGTEPTCVKNWLIYYFSKSFSHLEASLSIKKRKHHSKYECGWTFVQAGFVKRINTLNVYNYNYFVLSS